MATTRYGNTDAYLAIPSTQLTARARGAQIFQIQLAAVVQSMERDGQHQFHWVNGALQGTPPPGYDFYFADPPWHHYIEYLDTGYNMSNLDFPREMAPEDALRFGREQLGLYSGAALEAALGRLIQVLDENPDIDVSRGEPPARPPGPSGPRAGDVLTTRGVPRASWGTRKAP